jgi:hypothetical protein
MRVTALAVWVPLAAFATPCVLGCGGPAGSSSPAPASSCAGYGGLWAASDYSSSAVGAMSLEGRLTSTTGVDLGADPALSLSRGRAFFVARDSDWIFELDAACGTPTSRFSVHQSSHQGPSNPQDVAAANDGSLWVPLYDVPRLLVLTTTGAAKRAIDLSAYDADGNPNASAIAITDTPGGEKAFVALERLADHDNFKSEQASWMLRVDVATGTVETHVELAGRNAFGMSEDGAVLWLAEPGDFDSSTDSLAGVERFDTATSTTSLVVREKDLGASVAEVAVSGRCGAAIVADATPNVNATSLAVFDAATGAVIASGTRSPLRTDQFDLQGLVWKGDSLLVGDRRRTATGYPVHVFDVGPSCSLIERGGALVLPLPPVAFR